LVASYVKEEGFADGEVGGGEDVNAVDYFCKLHGEGYHAFGTDT
jgi:hypothetical protein